MLSPSIKHTKVSQKPAKIIENLTLIPIRNYHHSLKIHFFIIFVCTHSISRVNTGTSRQIRLHTRHKNFILHYSGRYAKWICKTISFWQILENEWAGIWRRIVTVHKDQSCESAGYKSPATVLRKNSFSWNREVLEERKAYELGENVFGEKLKNIGEVSKIFQKKKSAFLYSLGIPSST